MILVGSKPVSNFDQESEIPRSMAINTHTRVKGDILATPSSLDGNKNPSLDENKISIDDRNVSISLEEPTGDKISIDGRNVSISLEEPTGDHKDEENGSDNEDDELRRRVEEFINKVNQGWRTELSRHHV
ncbi:unnamed protein product [Dovyalis caffra]|uniref:Uncharacterized protein n=1 Tax=Dovyalis caffra TaxID=77055 RepID=A0AAV1RK26_9ROSI|nr:unnamed protein product [Dovyalis caffra]